VRIELFSAGIAQFTPFARRPSLFFHYKMSHMPHNKDILESLQKTLKIPSSAGIVEFESSEALGN
jgi:hypothetical protein